MNRSILLLLPLLTIIVIWLLKPDHRAVQDTAQLERDRQDKQLIEEARQRKDIAALETFIRDNPQSGWREVAIFYRDEFAYREATAKGDAKSLEQYIRRYPDSQWKTFAEQRLEQIRREEKARQERLQRQRKLAGKPVPLPGSNGSVSAPGQPASQAIFEAPGTAAPDARERVQRALSIYEQQREEKKFDEYQQKQRQKAEQERKRNCIRMRDQLKQFDTNIRWYQLDAEGKRVFLDEQQVAKRRRETENYLKRNCR